MNIRLLVISDDELFIGLVGQMLNNNVDYEYLNLLEAYSPKTLIGIKPHLTIVNLNKSIDKYNGLKEIIDQLKLNSKLYLMCAEKKHNGEIHPILESFTKNFQEGILYNTHIELNEQSIFISNLINFNLSKRETDVVLLITKGYSYKDIVRELDLSIDTVRTHIKNIYSKLDVTSKSKAISKVLGYSSD